MFDAIKYTHFTFFISNALATRLFGNKHVVKETKWFCGKSQDIMNNYTINLNYSKYDTRMYLKKKRGGIHLRGCIVPLFLAEIQTICFKV